MIGKRRCTIFNQLTASVVTKEALAVERVCIVGSGTRFLSGISQYTYRMAQAMNGSYSLSVILMRQLLPGKFYPGRKRIGQGLAGFQYDDDVTVFDGVDWYWLPTIFGAIATLVKQRPQIVLLHWWTGVVLHSYLLLALVARLLGAKVVIEYHEIMDKSEAEIPWARTYVRLLSPLLERLVNGIVVHSKHDEQTLLEINPTRSKPIAVIPHSSYDHYETQTKLRHAPAEAINLLYFGVVRPFKGLEDLIRAFDKIPPDQIENYWLTVVGEPWENWTLPFELIAQSRYRHRMTIVDRYVTDDEASAYFAGADVVVLPYHKSSASGPLHIAMSQGLPVITTKVGGLPEAVEGYEGCILVPPQNETELHQAIMEAATWVGQKFEDPHSWSKTLEHYSHLFEELVRRKK